VNGDLDMKFLWIFFIALFFSSCSFFEKETGRYSGRLEAETYELSARVQGVIDSLWVQTGDAVAQGEPLLLVDRKRSAVVIKQQSAQQEELQANLTALRAQFEQAEAQLALNRLTHAKTKNMAEQGAATSLKLDELETAVKVTEAQISALRAQIKAIDTKKAQLQAAMELTRLNWSDALLRSPVNGRVLECYINPGEMAIPGRTVIEIADLSLLEATFYMPLTRLDAVKIGQDVQVFIDSREVPITGQVFWISDESEFTPKTVLTGETRSTLVYAVKVRVANSEGLLKIGMPVEIGW